jgi:hypothetical protein
LARSPASVGERTVKEYKNICPTVSPDSVIKKKRKPANQNRKKKRNCNLYCFNLRWISIKKFIKLIKENKLIPYKKDLNFFLV